MLLLDRAGAACDEAWLESSIASVEQDEAKSDLPAISVVGLGYVGAVSMACLAHLGFRMIGVDVAPDKVSAIQAGRSPIVEDRLGELLMEGREANLIDATHDLFDAVLNTDVTFVSVGTPTSSDGSCDLTYVREASRAIGRAIAAKNKYHVVVLRCSVPPGTTLGVVAPEIEASSGLKLGADFGVCFNPEFLREGVAVADFFDPPKTVVGASDLQAAEVVAKIYSEIDDHAIMTSIEAAEMVKYVDNVWHATKVTFGNEVGRLCKSLGIDSHVVMDIFVRDTKLNLSPYYLKPGFAFGGSCLPKEVRAVSHLAREQMVDLPLIGSLMASNRGQVLEAHRLLDKFSGARVGFMGVTFKPGTDDIRESPVLDLMSLLLDEGRSISAYDPNLRFDANLKGQINYVRHSQPHLTDLLGTLQEIVVDDAEAFLDGVDVVVVAHATPEFRALVESRPERVHVIDLARLFKSPPAEATYQGIAW